MPTCFVPVCGGELGLPKPGQMVAVKTNAIKAEGGYHRAVIRAVNEAQGKAKLRLVHNLFSESLVRKHYLGMDARTF